jgi:hypothetical protein
LENRYHDPRDETDVTYEDVECWVDDTHNLIKDAFNQGEAAAFLNDAGVRFNENPMSVSIEQYGNRYNMKARLVKLHGLYREAPELPIEDDFDTQKWEGWFKIE